MGPTPFFVPDPFATVRGAKFHPGGAILKKFLMTPGGPTGWSPTAVVGLSTLLSIEIQQFGDLRGWIPVFVGCFSGSSGVGRGVRGAPVLLN